MAEFQVGAHTYRSGKIPAMEQFHLAARLSPLLVAFLDARQGLLAAKAASGAAEPVEGADGATPAPEAAPDASSELVSIAKPIIAAIAGMSDEDREYVLAKCFAVTNRKVGNTWAPIWDKRVRGLVYHDLTVFEIFGIAQQVIQDNIGPFGSGFPTGLSVG